MQGYRNKCEFTIGFNSDGEIEVGFVYSILNGNPVVYSASGCLHIPYVMQEMCQQIKVIVEMSKLPVYDRKLRTGIWRIVMMRYSKWANEVGIVFQVNKLSSLAQRDYIQHIILENLTNTSFYNQFYELSIYLNENSNVCDSFEDALDSLSHIYGKTHIQYNLSNVLFDVSPLSFFQVNTATCNKLYATTADWLLPIISNDTILFDICCGSGGIALYLSKHYPNNEIIGIEMNESAVKDARRNASLNGFGNVEFVIGKAENVLMTILESKHETMKHCVAIVDPPRGGLNPRVIAAIMQTSSIAHMVYISCNPITLVQDCKRLCGTLDYPCKPFSPERIVPVDMFPHTFHCEMILLLKRSAASISSVTFNPLL